jgi:hypothetical protein
MRAFPTACCCAVHAPATAVDVASRVTPSPVSPLSLQGPLFPSYRVARLHPDIPRSGCLPGRGHCHTRRLRARRHARRVRPSASSRSQGQGRGPARRSTVSTPQCTHIPGRGGTAVARVGRRRNEHRVENMRSMVPACIYMSLIHANCMLLYMPVSSSAVTALLYRPPGAHGLDVLPNLVFAARYRGT